MPIYLGLLNDNAAINVYDLAARRSATSETVILCVTQV